MSKTIKSHKAVKICDKLLNGEYYVLLKDGYKFYGFEHPRNAAIFSSVRAFKNGLPAKANA